MSEYIVERSKDEFGWDVYRVNPDETKTYVSWQILEDDAIRVANGLADGRMGEVNGYVIDRT